MGDPAKYRAEALVNFRITQAMGIHTFAVDAGKLAASRPTMIVDAMFGTGLSERPREPFDEIADRGTNRPGVYDLEMAARVNGTELSRGNFNDIYWSFGDIIARASN